MNIRIFQINNDRDLHGVKFTDYDFTARYQGSEDIDASIYDEVFAGPVDCNHPEDVYRMFNTEGHPLHRGHSLSVSDVVKIEGDIPPVVGRIRFYNSPTAFEECTYYDEQTWKREIEEARDVGRTIEVDDLRGQGVYDTEQGFYFCDRVGFKKIDFDDTQVHKPDDLMRVVYVEPNKPPYEAEIEPTLRGEQRAVKGLIECVYNGDDTCLVCNEEAKLIGMEGNRRIGDGTSIIAGPFFVCGLTEDDFRSLTDEEVNKYMQRFAEPEQISQDEVAADTGFRFYFGDFQ